MSCRVAVEQRLREVALRVTEQRLAVGQALRHAGAHRTAEELQSRLQAESSRPVSLATVYRTLRTLTAHRVVGRFDAGRSSDTYEWIDPGEGHHHARCVDCGAEVDIAPRPLERFERALRVEAHFTPFLDHLALVGRCAGCEAASRP